MLPASSTLSVNLISPKTLSSLRPHEITVLDKILKLIDLDARKNPSHIPRAWPSLAWLAKQSGVSLWTVSRSIQRLRRAGLITKFQLRDKAGEWHTNVYRLGKSAHAQIKNATEKTALWVSRQMASDNQFKGRVLAAFETAKDDLTAWRRRYDRAGAGPSNTPRAHRLRLGANNVLKTLKEISGVVEKHSPALIKEL